MAETTINKLEIPNVEKIVNNIGENLVKNVKFNELTKNGFNLTPEQMQIAQQMTNIMQQQFKSNNNTLNQNTVPPQNMAQQNLQSSQPNLQPKSILKDTKIQTPNEININVTEPQLTSDYYSLFGFQLSKTTIYIIIGFIIIAVIYFLYIKLFSYTKEDTNKKKKKKQDNEVSYEEQEKLNKDDKDE
jgi:hypothetical protein